jgi:hypothetical protein
MHQSHPGNQSTLIQVNAITGKIGEAEISNRDGDTAGTKA